MRSATIQKYVQDSVTYIEQIKGCLIGSLCCPSTFNGNNHNNVVNKKPFLSYPNLLRFSNIKFGLDTEWHIIEYVII